MISPFDGIGPGRSEMFISRKTLTNPQFFRYIDGMSAAAESHQAFHRGTTPIFELLTVEQLHQLSQLQADPSLAGRIEELAEKANEGELTDSEIAEYEAYIEANNLLATLQAEARFRLMRPGA